ncbi:hypothetical protein L2Y96_18140 [Luteibacter aegosomaticola]|uniref:hypothetical protein n=1 Tax=Luteibacter aegosomaticola TaxID=2911538 RepID=UPI001FF76832|nr:hypothetical protein [Luteibacter aegosomaticola]UPG89299.1 hypothetical protein L2Y96_18140 [Luteibacter aegosomaticola]
MSEETTGFDGFNMGELLAQRAVLLALIATHPDKELLRKAIHEASLGLSATALQGNQPDGAQQRFDRSIDHFLRTTELSF